MTTRVCAGLRGMGFARLAPWWRAARNGAIRLGFQINGATIPEPTTKATANRQTPAQPTPRADRCSRSAKGRDANCYCLCSVLSIFRGG